MQINPSGTELIFSETNKVRKLDFATGLYFYWFVFRSRPIETIKKLIDYVSTIAGSVYGGFQNGNALSATFYLIDSIAIDWNNSPDIIFVSDWGNNCIRMINQTSSIVSTYTGICDRSFGYKDGPLPSALFASPYSIRYLSSSLGTILLVADYSNNAIRMINITSGLFQKLI